MKEMKPSISLCTLACLPPWALTPLSGLYLGLPAAMDMAAVETSFTWIWKKHSMWEYWLFQNKNEYSTGQVSELLSIMTKQATDIHLGIVSHVNSWFPIPFLSLLSVCVYMHAFT